MAWTKINSYMSIIFVTLIIFTSLGIIGTNLVNNDRISLNEKSLDYIAEVKGTSSDSGFDAIAETDAGDSNTRGILDGDDNRSVSEDGDFLSTLFIKKERASEPTNLFKLIYNIPTSLLTSVGFPLDDFKHITNIISYFLFVGLLIMVWIKLIRT